MTTRRISTMKKRYSLDKQLPVYLSPKLKQRGKTRGNAGKQYSVARIIALEKQFKNICEEIYLLGGERFIPMHPYVLVRLIPRDMISPGGIVIPDQGQNKPLFEGIVLETYRPYNEYKSKSVTMDNYISPPCTETIAVHRECPVKRGDRVL